MTHIKQDDVHFEPIGATGPGGQHVNRNKTGVRATHLPSGLVVIARTRSLSHSKKKAMEQLRRTYGQELRAADTRKKQAKRKKAIAERRVIRTYNFVKGWVKNHPDGTKAELKEVLGKGRLELLKDGARGKKRKGKRGRKVGTPVPTGPETPLPDENTTLPG